MFFLSFVPFYPDENIWILIFLVLVTNPLAFHIFVVKLIRCTYMHIGTRKDLKNTQSWKVQNCVCCSQFLFFILTRSLLLPWIQVEMEFNFDFWRILLKLDVHHCLDLSSYVQLLLEPLKLKAMFNWHISIQSSNSVVKGEKLEGGEKLQQSLVSIEL